ncbi:SseB family protein [Streptomyces sp. AJS327]|uniref:SseB family protein n=1 Tax=Streptomyces sp. AJS327 TaxID=2545265 RepID=UPI0015E00DA7|nr:SseB family protein [Streptomyces sp. AJS327]
MALKNIPAPAFADDDGSADPALTRALAEWRADPARPGADAAVLGALATARLLVPVVAMLGESTTGEDGLRRDKSSDMAVPTLNAPGGRRALPVFSATATLARWRADARPVAVPLRQALLALAQEEADTLVLDLAGPVPYEVTGPALRALAEGRTSADPLGDPEVAEALRAVLATEPALLGATLTPGDADSDGTLALLPTAEVAVGELARRIAGALAADETLRARLVRGLNLAVLPPGTVLPPDALHRRPLSG